MARRRQNVERIAYSPREAAAALGMSETFIYELLRAGRIPHRRIGKRWLIPVSELETFLRGDTPATAGV